MTLPNTSKLDKVVKTLRQKGASEDQIKIVLDEVTKTVFAKVFTEATAVLTEEDLNAIDRASGQEEANFEISSRYFQRTGQDISTLAIKYTDMFADKFIEEAKSEDGKVH